MTSLCIVPVSPDFELKKLPPYLPIQGRRQNFKFGGANPWRMREGYGSVCVCVCVYVCHHASCFVPRLCIENTVLLSFLWRSQDMHCVDFVEIALFKSSQATFADRLPSSLLLTNSW